jgi:hypothetical protein
MRGGGGMALRRRWRAGSGLPYSVGGGCAPCTRQAMTVAGVELLSPLCAGTPVPWQKKGDTQKPEFPGIGHAITKVLAMDELAPPRLSRLVMGPVRARAAGKRHVTHHAVHTPSQASVPRPPATTSLGLPCSFSSRDWESH